MIWFFDDYYDDPLDVDVEPKQRHNCVCDVEWGTCPGRETCPYSGDNQGEDDEFDN